MLGRSPAHRRWEEKSPTVKRKRRQLKGLEAPAHGDGPRGRPPAHERWERRAKPHGKEGEKTNGLEAPDTAMDLAAVVVYACFVFAVPICVCRSVLFVKSERPGGATAWEATAVEKWPSSSIV